MRNLFVCCLLALALVASASAASLKCDVGAGPIWNQQNAEQLCPQTCAAWGGWSGQWVTVIQGKSSVCGCKGNAVDINAGPISNQDDANRTCPIIASSANGAWNGQWKTTVPGEMSVCGVLTCGPQ